MPFIYNSTTDEAHYAFSFWSYRLGVHDIHFGCRALWATSVRIRSAAPVFLAVLVCLHKADEAHPLVLFCNGLKAKETFTT